MFSSEFEPPLGDIEINPSPVAMDKGVAIFFNEIGGYLNAVPDFGDFHHLILNFTSPLVSSLLTPHTPLPRPYTVSCTVADRETRSEFDSSESCNKPSWGHAQRSGQSPGLMNFRCGISGLLRAWYFMRAHEGAKDAVMLLMRSVSSKDATPNELQSGSAHQRNFDSVFTHAGRSLYSSFPELKGAIHVAPLSISPTLRAR